MPTSLPTETRKANEIERTLLIADLSGYTALTETHGALHASEIVLRFGSMAEASLEPGVIDPVCRMRVDIEHPVATAAYEGATYHFCSHECARLFTEAPERYVGP